MHKKHKFSLVKRQERLKKLKGRQNQQHLLELMSIMSETENLEPVPKREGPSFDELKDKQNTQNYYRKLTSVMSSRSNIKFKKPETGMIHLPELSRTKTNFNPPGILKLTQNVSISL